MQNSVVFLLLFIVLRHFVALLHFNSYLLHFFALLATRGNPVHCAPQQRIFFTSAYKLLLHILCRLLLFFALFFFFKFFSFYPSCFLCLQHGQCAFSCRTMYFTRNLLFIVSFPVNMRAYLHKYIYVFICVCVCVSTYPVCAPSTPALS